LDHVLDLFCNLPSIGTLDRAKRTIFTWPAGKVEGGNQLQTDPWILIAMDIHVGPHEIGDWELRLALPYAPPATLAIQTGGSGCSFQIFLL
jgi:hypothetical protein